LQLSIPISLRMLNRSDWFYIRRFKPT